MSQKLDKLIEDIIDFKIQGEFMDDLSRLRLNCSRLIDDLDKYLSEIENDDLFRVEKNVKAFMIDLMLQSICSSEIACEMKEEILDTSLEIFNQNGNVKEE